jgi:hypothetical protein
MGGGYMNPELFLPTAEGEVRLLLLIDAFSNQAGGLQGRTKLAKLDFLLRYPAFFRRALVARQSPVNDAELLEDNPIEQRMVRYRYGPWDPSYFAILGSLIGRGLVEIVPYDRGLGYKTTDRGAALAVQMREQPAWSTTVNGIVLLRRHFNLAGATLKRLIYEWFPEVHDARWSDQL